MPFLIIAFGITLQVYLTYKKVSPFLSLLIVAILIGLFLGMEPTLLIASIEKGVGNTLSGLVLILCLGAVLGKILEVSGAIHQITSRLIQNFGERYVQWAVLLTGFMIGLPLYYNAGFILLVPLVFSVARKTGLPLLFIAIPTAASLSATHCFLPPHPGPVVLVNAFGADLGLTLLYGLLLVIPTVVVAGPLLGKVLRNIKRTEPEKKLSVGLAEQNANPPTVLASFTIALLPVILITLAVVMNQFFTTSEWVHSLINFVGNATIALLITVCIALYILGLRRGIKMNEVMQWVSEGIHSVAMILLIITAGGILKEVLIDSGTADYITSFSSRWNMNPYLFAWVITALLRISLGSATVAGLTAAGIVSPLLLDGGASPELMVLAVGAGSVFGSHINDTGFWMFKEFFNLSLKETFLSWTIMESLMSILGIIGVLILQLITSWHT